MEDHLFIIEFDQSYTHLVFHGESISEVSEEVTGEEILQQLESVPLCSFGKTQKKRKWANIELSWTKSSIFFELPYWLELKL